MPGLQELVATKGGRAAGPPTAGAPTAGAPTAGAPTAAESTAGTAGAPTAAESTAGAPTAAAPTATGTAASTATGTAASTAGTASRATAAPTAIAGPGDGSRGGEARNDVDVQEIFKEYVENREKYEKEMDAFNYHKVREELLEAAMKEWAEIPKGEDDEGIFAPDPDYFAEESAPKHIGEYITDRRTLSPEILARAVTNGKVFIGGGYPVEKEKAILKTPPPKKGTPKKGNAGMRAVAKGSPNPKTEKAKKKPQSKNSSLFDCENQLNDLLCKVGSKVKFLTSNDAFCRHVRASSEKDDSAHVKHYDKELWAQLVKVDKKETIKYEKRKKMDIFMLVFVPIAAWQKKVVQIVWTRRLR
jgi:hypothetical protein